MTVAVWVNQSFLNLQAEAKRLNQALLDDCCSLPSSRFRKKTNEALMDFPSFFSIQ